MSIEASDTEAKIPQHGGSSPETELPIATTTSATPTPSTNNDEGMGVSRERRQRPLRACTTRSASRLNPAAPVVSRKPVKKEKVELQDQQQQQQQCSKIITPLVEPPSLPAQFPRWNIRSMWELASILNFLNVFRPLLNITVEFTAEELETALLTPNSTLDDIHMPLLKLDKAKDMHEAVNFIKLLLCGGSRVILDCWGMKLHIVEMDLTFLAGTVMLVFPVANSAIPPVTRMALGRATWVTVLCRKLRDWWHWVAEGDIPIVASQGAEVEVYKALDPGIRVVILKALCDIRVEQEDIRNYIDGNLKHGVHLSLFRKERIGGDSHGVSFWYEDDPIIGHRLYREIRKVELKKVKTKGVLHLPTVTCQWEPVATNLEEFEEVSEKLFSSKSRIEAAVGKKLKNDMLPEIEAIQKKKEKLLKKQHRQALLLDSYLGADGIPSGRSLRDRKPVTYTFDDFDRSISEAIKITKKKPPSPEPPAVKREMVIKPEASTNGRVNGRLHAPRQPVSYDEQSPKSSDSEGTEEEDNSEPLDRSNRRRKRPQRYSEKEFVEDVSENDADFDSDDDIVGEAVYDEEYLRSRKQRKVSSSSEGEDEQSWEDENVEDDEEEEEEDEYMSSSEGSDAPRKFRKVSTRGRRRETKLRSVDELQSGLRRSRRASRNRINYRQYEFSDSDDESTKPEGINGSDERQDPDNDMEYSAGTQDSPVHENDQKMAFDQPVNQYNHMVVDVEPRLSPEKTNKPVQEAEGVGRRHFLDLNELAPGTGFDDGPSMITKDDERDNF